MCTPSAPQTKNKKLTKGKKERETDREWNVQSQANFQVVFYLLFHCFRVFFNSATNNNIYVVTKIVAFSFCYSIVIVKRAFFFFFLFEFSHVNSTEYILIVLWKETKKFLHEKIIWIETCSTQIGNAYTYRFFIRMKCIRNLLNEI